MVKVQGGAWCRCGWRDHTLIKGKIFEVYRVIIKSNIGTQEERLRTYMM